MRYKRKSPIVPIILVLALVLAGVMTYNSGILVDIGLMKGNIPEDLVLNPEDTRIVENTEGPEGFKKTLNTIINLVTGRVEQGQIQVFASDTGKGFALSGLVFEVVDAASGELKETLVTGADGSALSMALDYRRAYKVRQVSTPNPYVEADTEIVFEMKAPKVELKFDQVAEAYAIQYTRAEDGSIQIDELKLEVPLLLQKPELPNGCEITALTSLLNFKGYAVDKVLMSDTFLAKAPFTKVGDKLYGPDPDIAFSGDPKSPKGWFAYAPPLVKAGNDYLATVAGKHKVVDLTGKTKEEIMAYVMDGNPVAVWVTRTLGLGNFAYGWYIDGTETYLDAPTNLHCMVVHGIVGNQLYVMDPLEGSMIYDKEQFFTSYMSLGSRAMVIEEATDAE